MKPLLTTFCFVFICLNNGVVCSNVLGVFLAPSKSHYILGTTLLEELAERGHNVTMLSPFSNGRTITNYTEVTLENLQHYVEEMTREITSKSKSWLTQIRSLVTMFLEINHVILGQNLTQDLLKADNHFDVIIYDSPGFDVFIGFSHRFNAPAILFSPFGDMAMFPTYTGNYRPLSYLGADNTEADGQTINFIGRMKNVGHYFLNKFLAHTMFLPKLRDVLHTYFPDVTLEQLRSYITIALLNSHFTYETARPYTPNMVQIGGFNFVRMKPIEPELQKWLDEAEHGVIFISFGTKIRGYIFDEEKVQMFVNSAKNLKYKVLWTFDKHIDNLPDNLRMERWVPQKEILSHPNIKAFITHGGMGGMTEAIYGGIPMIAIPFYGDQIRNADTIHTFGYGIKMQYDTLTEDQLLGGILEVTTNPIYYNTIQEASEAFRNQPINPMDTAVYWIEYVIRHRNVDHLKPASLKLNILQELLIDVASFIMLVLSLSLYLTYKILRKIMRCCIKTKANHNTIQ